MRLRIIPLILFFIFFHPTITAQQKKPDSIATALFSEENYWKLIDLSEEYGIDTMSARFRYTLGMSYASLSELQRAQELLKQAVLLDSSAVQYRYQFGRILTQSGLFDDVIVQLVACIAMDSNYIPARFQSDHAEAYYFMGLSYRRLTENQNALRAFGQFIRKTENDTSMIEMRISAEKIVESLKSGKK